MPSVTEGLKSSGDMFLLALESVRERGVSGTTGVQDFASRFSKLTKGEVTRGEERSKPGERLSFSAELNGDAGVEPRSTPYRGPTR